jgi:hypothetical protein
MKKIKLNSGKLKLKRESIGNILNKDAMKQVVGGNVDLTTNNGTICNWTNTGGTFCNFTYTGGPLCPVN